MDFSVFDKYAKNFKDGQIIFLEFEPGDKFYLIQEGKVKIAKISGDIEKTIDILPKGEVFGEMAVLEAQPRSASAIAVGETRLLEFTKENFESLIKMNPAFGIKLLKVFANRIISAKRRMMILQLKEPENRIIDCFLMLAEQKGIDRSAYSSSQEFDVTVESVASWCGLHTKETEKVLMSFHKTHRIEMKNNTITVKNLNEFQRTIDSKRRAASSH